MTRSSKLERGIIWNDTCVTRYYCIVNVCVIVAFINSSLYSSTSHKQDKEMDNLNLFIDYHYKYIVSIIRVKLILTLHLSTANWRIKLTTGCCCREHGCCLLHMLCNIFLPGRVNTTVPWVVVCFQCTFMDCLILLYFIEMLPCTVSSFCLGVLIFLLHRQWLLFQNNNFNCYKQKMSESCVISCNMQLMCYIFLFTLFSPRICLSPRQEIMGFNNRGQPLFTERLQLDMGLI